MWTLAVMFMRYDFVVSLQDNIELSPKAPLQVKTMHSYERHLFIKTGRQQHSLPLQDLRVLTSARPIFTLVLTVRKPNPRLEGVGAPGADESFFGAGEGTAGQMQQLAQVC
eukprot:g6238.t1